MPSLDIDENTSFFYLDSGRPQQDTYTTIFMVHGYGFQSYVFRRLLPFAPSKGLRLICFNRRDYAPTTLYTPAELSALASGSAGLAEFLEARGVEIAVLIYRLIEELSLPPPSIDGKDGGIALMGWSLGNMTSIAAFASAASIPKEIHKRLQVHLRRFVLYSVPSLVIGTPPPPNGYIPLFDESIPQANRGAIFADWVSSYYNHGDVSTRDAVVLNVRTPVPGSRSTVAGFSPEDFMSVVDMAPGERSERFFSSDPEVLVKQTHKAVSDPNIRALWPNTEIWCMYGDQEPWNIIYGTWEIEKKAKFAGTDVKFLIVPGTNHFGFWEEPEKTLDVFYNACH